MADEAATGASVVNQATVAAAALVDELCASLPDIAFTDDAQRAMQRYVRDAMLAITQAMLAAMVATASAR